LETNELVGSKVEAVQSTGEALGYLWEVLSNTSTTITIGSGSSLKLIQDLCYQVGSDYYVNINVIDKFSCKGHCESGLTSHFKWWADDHPWYGSAAYSSLVLDGINFDSIGSAAKSGSPWQIVAGNGMEITSASSAGKGGRGLFIRKPTTSAFGYISQTMSFAPNSEVEKAIERNQKYILYIRYYGYSLTSTQAYFKVRIACTYKGSTYYYNFQTGTWQSSSVFKNAYLLGSSYKTDFGHGFMSNIKLDELLVTVPFNLPLTGSRPYTLSSLVLSIHGEINEAPFEALISPVMLVKYVPHQHFGGFPSMPFSSVWYI